MKRCQHPSCGGLLGLGTVTGKVWNWNYWWYDTFKFCSNKCREAFFKGRAEERERRIAIAKLYRPP